MLIRGQTTEERIGEIARGFQQGVEGFSAGQRRYNAALKDRNNSEDKKALQAKEEERYQSNKVFQAEAAKRQRAIQAVEVSNNLSAQTGKFISPSQVESMLDSGNFEGIGDILKSAPATRKSQLEEAAQKRQDRKDNLDEQYKVSQINKNNSASTAKAAEKNDPSLKLEKLGAEGRSKVGSIASGLQALDQMAKASQDGHGPQFVDSNTPLVGNFVSDNPYSEAERTTAEVVGRLQSGGAMNKDEIVTFKSLGPRPGDDADTRARKLVQQRDFLKNKLTAFGMKEDELSTLGFELTSKYEPKTKKQPGTLNVPGVSNANAGDPIQQIRSMTREQKIKMLSGG